MRILKQHEHRPTTSQAYQAPQNGLECPYLPLMRAQRQDGISPLRRDRQECREQGNVFWCRCRRCQKGFQLAETLSGGVTAHKASFLLPTGRKRVEWAVLVVR